MRKACAVWAVAVLVASAALAQAADRDYAPTLLLPEPAVTGRAIQPTLPITNSDKPAKADPIKADPAKAEPIPAPKDTTKKVEPAPVMVESPAPVASSCGSSCCPTHECGSSSCCPTHECTGGRTQRLRDWLTYRPIRGGCGCCVSACCCHPPLYVYFLDHCPEGCGCGGCGCTSGCASGCAVSHGDVPVVNCSGLHR